MIIPYKVNEAMKVLGLENESYLSSQVIKASYLKLSKKYHPDVCENQYKDGEMFKKINEANAYLNDNLDEVNQYLSNPSAYANMNNDQYQENYQNQYQQYQYYYANPENVNIKIHRVPYLLYFISFILPLLGLINGLFYRVINKRVSRVCFTMMALGIFVQFFLPFFLR